MVALKWQAPSVYSLMLRTLIYTLKTRAWLKCAAFVVVFLPGKTLVLLYEKSQEVLILNSWF